MNISDSFKKNPNSYAFQNKKEARTIIEICRKYKTDRREYRSEVLVLLAMEQILIFLDQSSPPMMGKGV